MANSLPQDSDNPNEPVGQIIPPPDAAEQENWTAQLLSKGYQAIEAWNEQVEAYNAMVAQRARFGMPPYDDKWTKQDDDNFWQMDVIVRTFADRLDEVQRGIRNVGFSTALDTVVAIGHAGEQYIEVTKDGGLKLSTSKSVINKSTFSGTVGDGGLSAGVVIVIVVISIAVAITIWQICTYLNSKISSAAASDVQKHAEELAKQGYTPEQIKEILEKENQQLEAQKKDPNAELYSALKVTAVVVAILGVVGAGVWAARTYLSPKGRSQNPTHAGWQVIVWPREGKPGRAEHVTHDKDEAFQVRRAVINNKRRNVFAAEVWPLYEEEGPYNGAERNPAKLLAPRTYKLRGGEERTVVPVYEHGVLYVIKREGPTPAGKKRPEWTTYTVTENVTGNGYKVIGFYQLADAKHFTHQYGKDAVIERALKDSLEGRYGTEAMEQFKAIVNETQRTVRSVMLGG